jgi:hypothetical protein
LVLGSWFYVLGSRLFVLVSVPGSFVPRVGMILGQ